MHEVVLIVCNTFCRVYEENTTIFRWRNRLVVFITRQVIYGPGLHRLLPRIPGVCRSYCGHIQNTGCYWFNIMIMGYVPLGAGFYTQGVRSTLSSGSTLQHVARAALQFDLVLFCQMFPTHPTWQGAADNPRNATIFSQHRY